MVRGMQANRARAGASKSTLIVAHLSRNATCHYHTLSAPDLFATYLDHGIAANPVISIAFEAILMRRPCQPRDSAVERISPDRWHERRVARQHADPDACRSLMGRSP
jgi:hypothetical protein